MCDLSAGFKLCSCPDGSDEFDWELQRHDPSLPRNLRRGRAAQPRYTESEQATIDLVIAALEAGRAFDFEHEPVDGDVLLLRLDDRSYRFRVEQGHWVRDDSHGLTIWRTQMVKLVEGCVET